MSADTILAIDPGRYKSVACVYDRRTREHAFRTLDTTADERTILVGPGDPGRVACCERMRANRASTGVRTGVQPAPEPSVLLNSIGHQSGSAS